MGETTGISWTDATWNPWIGCTKVSPACANCYMFRDAKRFGFDPREIRRSKTMFYAPLDPKKYPPGRKVFVCSWSDFFHPGADQWRSEAWEVIRQRPDLIFQILTKRPERISECLPEGWDRGWPNVWLGVTAENQDLAEERVPKLLKVRAAVYFVSAEPLLGPLTLKKWFRNAKPVKGTLLGIPLTISVKEWAALSGSPGLDLVIAGGESGPNARPSHPDWFRQLRDECQASGIAFHFKQHGEWVAVWDRDKDDPEGRNLPAPDGRTTRFLNIDGTSDINGKRLVLMRRVGIKKAGRELDGRIWDDLPA